jgi:hypothetical protein
VVADPDRLEPDLLSGASDRCILGPSDLTLYFRELNADAK